MKKQLSALLSTLISASIILTSVACPSVALAKTSYPNAYVTYDFEEGCPFDVADYGKYHEQGGEGLKGKLSFVAAGDEEDIELVDHTLGTAEGNVLKIGPRTAKTSRLKFVDLLNPNGITAKDLGSVYEVKMWLYNPQNEEVSVSLGMYSNRLYDTSGQMYETSGTDNINNTSNVTSAISGTTKSYNIPSGEWTEITYECTPITTMATSVSLVLGSTIPTIYIDDISVEIKTDNRIVNDDNDLTPFAEIERFDITAQLNDDAYDFADGDYIKYAAGKEYFNTRYIPEDDAIYKINLRASSLGEALKIVATSVNIDKTVGRDDEGEFLSEFNMDVVEDYTLTSGMNDANKAEVLSYTVSGTEIETGKTIIATTDDEANPVYKEFSILFKDFGSTNLSVYEGKKADVLRGFDIIADDDAGYSVKNYEVKKIDKDTPVQNSDFAKADFSDWGFSDVPDLFVIEDEKLKITNGSEAKSISQTVAVKQNTNYKLNYKITNANGAKVKLEITDISGNVIASSIPNATGEEKDKFVAFTAPTDVVNVKITSLADTEGNTAVLDDIQLEEATIDEIETYEEGNNLVVYGNLEEYTVSDDVNVYLVKEGFEAEDYTNTEAVFAQGTAAVSGNVYEYSFNMSTVTSYYSDFHIVVTGMEEDEYITEDITYESKSFKENLITNIKEADSKETVKTYITGGETPKNTEVLGIDEIDVYNEIKDAEGYIEFLSEYIYENKDDVYNELSPADETYICNVVKAASILYMVNNDVVTDDELIDYIELYDEILKLSDNDAYTNIFEAGNDSVKADILENILEALEEDITSTDKLSDLISEYSIKHMFNSNTSYSKIMEIIEENRDFLQIDDDTWNIYDDLSSKYKPAAGKKIAAYAKKANDLMDIAGEIEDLVDEAKDDVDDDDGGSSSGGGGGSRPTVSVTTPDVIIPPVENEDITPTAKFTDLSDAQWAKDYIESFVSKGIINGYDDGTFKPNNPITRKEFAKILALSFDVYDADSKYDFADVKNDDWSYSYIASLANLGVVKGDENENYNPDANITRQDMAVMVYRILEVLNLKENLDANLLFKDTDTISDYALASVGYLTKAGVISGMGDNTFAPLENATRAQAVKILDSLIK